MLSMKRKDRKSQIHASFVAEKCLTRVEHSHISGSRCGRAFVIALSMQANQRSFGLLVSFFRSYTCKRLSEFP